MIQPSHRRLETRTSSPKGRGLHRESKTKLQIVHDFCWKTKLKWHVPEQLLPWWLTMKLNRWSPQSYWQKICSGCTKTKSSNWIVNVTDLLSLGGVRRNVLAGGQLMSSIEDSSKGLGFFYESERWLGKIWCLNIFYENTFQLTFRSTYPTFHQHLQFLLSWNQHFLEMHLRALQVSDSNNQNPIGWEHFLIPEFLGLNLKLLLKAYGSAGLSVHWKSK